LKRTASIARSSTGYTIVLLLTDGVLNDVQETIDALVDLSFLPVSVIIVGVGNADFSQMRVLDADVNPLTNSRGVRAARDCVQFVEFNRLGQDGSLLARETLMELPGQLVQYMTQNKRVPGRPITVRDEEIQTVGLFPPVGAAPVAVAVVPPAPIGNSGSLGQTGRDVFRGAISM
jgi:hypothetical protein